MKILWLCSWYPHRSNPYEGDFIQRHARALSGFSAITVFYVFQDGIAQAVERDEVTTNEFNGSSENIIMFRFKRTGLRVLDTLAYNAAYYKTYKKAIEQYIAAEGKPDIVHIHVPMKAGMVGRWIKKKWGIPYLVSEHSSHYNGNTDDDFLNRSRLYQSLVKRIFREAIAVTNVSEAIGSRLKELFGLAGVRVIRNTVNTDLFYYTGQTPARFRFIHVSTLATYQKNIDGMLNAFQALSRQHQDFELVIVGPATNDLRQKVSAIGLNEFVTFTGEISYPEVARQMQQASSLVLFSRFENFPCVIIEALCCGLPVITSDTGGTKEAVDSTNGIVVAQENEQQLQDALLTMISNYQQFDRKKIADESRFRYSYAAIGKKFYNLYTELISCENKKHLK